MKNKPKALWNLFERTGNIEAYLLYAGIDSKEDEDKTSPF